MFPPAPPRKRGPGRVSIIAHQPDDRPRVILSAKSWVTCPDQVRASAPVRTNLTFTEKAVVGSSSWDSDHGAGGRRRKGQFVSEPASYTARTPSTTGKSVKGLSVEATAPLAHGVKTKYSR